MSCYFDQWAYFLWECQTSTMKGRALVCRCHVSSRGGECGSRAPINQSLPHSKNHPCLVRSSVRKRHFCAAVPRPGALKRQGTAGPDGDQWAPPVFSAPRHCRGSVLWPWVCSWAPQAQRSERRYRHRFPQGNGWWEREQTPCVCFPLHSPAGPSPAHDQRHGRPLHTAVPTAAPRHQGLLTVLSLHPGSEFGRRDLQSWWFSNILSTSPRLLNNFRSLNQTEQTPYILDLPVLNRTLYT